MQQIAKGDQRALLLLYERYGNLVFSLALRVLHRSDLAEEVTQDVFLKVWLQPNRWDARIGKLSSWLLTIARNAAIDRLRKERRQPIHNPTTLESNASELAYTDTVNNPMWHNGQLVRNLMTQLPTEQYHLVELAFFQGYTHSELSELLDLPLGTVKTRLRLGLKRLRILWEEAERAAMKQL